jgi:hypothetical protein
VSNDKLWQWSEGRQGTGYFKLKLFGLGKLLDLYLLRYPVGAYIPSHRDPVPGRRHWRLNLMLKQARNGGSFHWSSHGCDMFPSWWGLTMRHLDSGRALLILALPWNHYRRVMLFRSDLVEHGVLEVGVGTRWVLSLGISLPEAK